MQRNIASVLSENQELTRQNAELRRIVKRLALDFCVITRSPVPRLILWPSGLAEVDPLVLGIGKGKDVLAPEERFQYVERPVADLDDAVVLTLLRRAPLAEAPPDTEAHSPLCSAQAGPRSECPVCGPR